MRNLAQYPIGYQEVTDLLHQILDDINAENEKGFVCGDMRPAKLQWAIDRLNEYRTLEDLFEKRNAARRPTIEF